MDFGVGLGFLNFLVGILRQRRIALAIPSIPENGALFKVKKVHNILSAPWNAEINNFPKFFIWF